MNEAITALENAIEEFRSAECSDENEERYMQILNTLEHALEDLNNLAEEEETRYDRDDDDVSDDE